MLKAEIEFEVGEKTRDDRIVRHIAITGTASDINVNWMEQAPTSSIGDKGGYVLRFEAGKLPPVATFWNLAMYGADMLFVENDFGRYSFGSTTDGLKKNADGSLDIIIQNDKPADTSNWLPAPAGNFNLTMRFYGPQTPVLDGRWTEQRRTNSCRKSDASVSE